MRQLGIPTVVDRLVQQAIAQVLEPQQMLAIGPALMRGPDLLVLDEPSLGLSPILVQVIYRALQDVRRTGTTILLAEQSAHLALNLSDHGYVLETGHIILQGTAAAMKGDPRIESAYLGAVG